MFLVDVGSSHNLSQCVGCNRLHPYSLPNTCGACVGATGGIERGALLATGLLSATEVVVDTYNEVDCLSGYCKFGDVGSKR